MMRVWRRCLLTTTVCGLLLAVGALPAMADSIIRIDDLEEVTGPGQSNGGGNSNLPSGDDPVWRMDYDTDEDGEPCWRVILGGFLTYTQLVDLAETINQEGGFWGTNEQEAVPRCTNEGDDPVHIAMPWWLAVDLPSPTFSIPPGEPAVAMTGMRAFLVMDHAAPPSSTDTLPLSGNLVELEVRLDEYEIDWGDPNRDPYTTSDTGVPYPGGDGQVVHTYADAGEVTVTVTATWTGHFRIGNGAWQDVPGGPRGTQHSETFTVNELRSVRTHR